jgi:hypothetical protein
VDQVDQQPLDVGAVVVLLVVLAVEVEADDLYIVMRDLL